MALFKKSQMSKKSSGSGLFKSAPLAERHGATPAGGEQVPAAGFPTSEDLKQGRAPSHDDDARMDVDGGFLYGEVQHVSSSHVDWLRYDQGVLHIGYLDGGEYFCAGVDPATALQILRAPSVGKALKDLARSRGAFVKA
jgi:hypothetical protein